MAKEKTLACDQCDRKFSMPGHLARHQSATHGAKKAGKKKVAKNGRRKGAKKKAGAKRPGRPPAIATKFGLKTMPLDDLAALINAAKQEAAARLKQYRDLLAVTLQPAAIHRREES